MTAWNVYQDNGELQLSPMDTVFFNDDCDGWYVHNSLINHDGYPSDIYVEEDGNPENRYPPEEW